MSRFAGRNARIYVGLTNAAQATLMSFLNNWEISGTTDKFDVTAFGDASKTYVAGLPDASGTFAGWMDDATGQTYAAAIDGLSRKFYLYPNFDGVPGTYFFGTILLDASFSAGVDGAGTFSASWNAATPLQRNPSA